MAGTPVRLTPPNSALFPEAAPRSQQMTFGLQLQFFSISENWVPLPNPVA
jgi:hypothetical protein